METLIERLWHHTSADEVVKLLTSDAHKGLDRFEVAGLAAPRPTTVAPPPTVLCAAGAGEFPGYATFDLDLAEARIDLCRRERDICVDPACDTFHSDARSGVLHDLAHVSEYQNLDDATRDAFLARHGRQVWSDGEHACGEDEDIELAVEIIAWGLMDEATMNRILDVIPDDLTEAFHILTGTQPLVTTPSNG